MNPLATNHPLSWFKKFHTEGALDLTPRFQRKPVWSDAQAAYLIDSILNELPIPEVFLRTATSEAGETRVEVVDGQQRLRSIIRFFTNDLELDGDNVSERWRGYRWERLSPAERERFWAFKLVVRELEAASDVEVHDMFRRLNANQSSLNDQELRHSQYYGRFIALVEELANDRWWLANGIVTPAQVRRMLDTEFVSELLVGLMAGPLDKKKELDQFYADYDEDFPDEGRWRSAFRRTRDITEEVVGGDFDGWRSKTEYYSLFLACGRLVTDRKAKKDVSTRSIKTRIRAFRTKADRAKQKDNREPVPEYVRDYAEAATRASTDLGRRLYRIDVIHSLLLGQPPPQASAKE